MNILSLENIDKAFGEKIILEKASFYLQEGEKVGIIGINGTGKSTILRMIAGEEAPDAGSVTLANHVICSFLPQHPAFDQDDTVIEAVLKRSAQSSKHVDDGSRTTQAKTMLTKLGVTNFEQPCGNLSGGERKRLALVAVLLSDSDILVLDEPTNHLDHEMADWLEEQLKKREGAVIMVTHDRYFLDSVSNRIVEVSHGNLYSYQTNYSGFLALKAEREEMELASERKRQSILRKELEWVRRGARARTTKQKARLERYEDLKNASAPVRDSAVELSSASTRLGRTTLEIHDISKAYGEKTLIRDFTYFFLKDDRIGFVGRNGCGKSTLMKMLLGLIEPDSGEIVTGQTVKLGYYAQEISEQEMPPKQRVIDYIRDVAEYVQTKDGPLSAAKMLERFLFEGKEQYGPLGKLSGGEKRRLTLLKVLMGAPNILILDEPTNDLDITTLTILEDYLDSFEGIVIIVSHDRYFLDRTVRRIFAFEDGGTLRQHEGGYTDYHNRLLAEGNFEGSDNPKEKGKTNDKTDAKADWKKHSTKLKFTYQEQRDYDTIEQDIAELEAKVEALDEQIVKAATDFVKLNELSKEKEETEKLLEEKMDRWMYLEDLKARIDRGEMKE